MTYGHPVWLVLILLAAVPAAMWTTVAGYLWLLRRAGIPPLPMARAYFHEVKPAAVPLTVAGQVASSLWVQHVRLSDLATTATMVLVYFALRNVDKDDRWKRRARAFGQRVVRSVHRLRVVPAPAGAGA